MHVLLGCLLDLDSLTACWPRLSRSDMPGHAGSWCKGHPEICPSATCTQPLNVASNATFELIEDLLHQCTVRPMYPRLTAERSREVAESPALNELQGGMASAPGKPSPGIFKDNFIHLGGVRRPSRKNPSCKLLRGIAVLRTRWTRRAGRAHPPWLRGSRRRA